MMMMMVMVMMMIKRGKVIMMSAILVMVMIHMAMEMANRARWRSIAIPHVRYATPPGCVSHLGSARGVFSVLVQKGRVEVCTRGAPSANSR